MYENEFWIAQEKLKEFLKGWVENDCGYTNWDVLNNLQSATWIILCMPGTI